MKRRARSTNWHPQAIGDAVRGELDRFAGAGAMPDIVAAWPKSVGPAIAENAWPARTARDGTLHVAVSSSTWAFELMHLEATIRSRLRERVGDRAPERLRFAVGRLPSTSAESVESVSRTVPEVRDADLAAGVEIAAPIEDEELRNVVARAAAASLARHAADRSF